MWYAGVMGVNGNLIGCLIRWKRWGRKRSSGIDTGGLECSRGTRNSWCSGEMHRYHEELRLGRQLTNAPMTLMLESVGIKQD